MKRTYGSVNGFVQAVALALAVGKAAERCGGQQTKCTRDDRRLVGKNVTEHLWDGIKALQHSAVMSHPQSTCEACSRSQLRACEEHTIADQQACAQELMGKRGTHSK